MDSRALKLTPHRVVLSKTQKFNLYLRATVLEMDLDGKNQRSFAIGLRNAVGMKWVQGNLFVTNMGADHLGDFKPDDTMYIVEPDKNYGWPYWEKAGSCRISSPAFCKTGESMAGPPML